MIDEHVSTVSISLNDNTRLLVNKYFKEILQEQLNLHNNDTETFNLKRSPVLEKLIILGLYSVKPEYFQDNIFQEFLNEIIRR